MTETHQQDHFYRKMLFIAIPVALQNLITSALNTLDTMMISSLGDSAIAGVGLANQVFFFFNMICFGIATGSSVVLAQYWGRRDRRNVLRTNGLATLLSAVFGVLFTVAALFFPEQIMRLMIDDAEVIRQGTFYLGAVSTSYIVGGISFSLGNSLRSTGNPRTPLVASIIGFFINGFFNYVFIFGALGFPKLGIVGAAIGTLIARVVELLIILYVIRGYDGPLRGSILESLDFSANFVKRYARIVWPVIFNETFWALGQVLYSIAYAIIGREATAAIQVTVAIQNIVYVIIRGLGSSCTIMIGNNIGREQYDVVHGYARKFLGLSVVTGGTIGLFLSLTPQLTLSLFGNLSGEVLQLAIKLLQVMGVVFLFKSINSVIVVGILRGGGDTRYSMFVEMSCVWLVGVPLAFIGAISLKLPIYWLVALVAVEEVVKLIFGLLRIRSGKWVHEFVND